MRRGRRLPAARAAIAALAAAVGLAGCGSFAASFRHGFTLSSREGQVLRTASKSGAEALEIEKGYDRALRTYVDDKGDPDYIAVLSGTEVALVYLERDEVVLFDRGFGSSIGKYKVSQPISDKALRLLEQADRDAVLARRSGALEPDATGADPGTPTVSEVATSCQAIELSETDGKRCGIGYAAGDTVLWIDFGYPADEAFGSAPDLARRFCAATNAARRRGFVRFRVDARERAFACELARWGEWTEADAAHADSPL